MNSTIDHEAFRKFCRVGDTAPTRQPLTEKQTRAYTAWLKHRSLSKATEELGLKNVGTLSSLLQTIESKGYTL